MIMLSSSVENIINNNGFIIRYGKQDNESYAELNQGTPLGEDWFFTIWFDQTEEGFIQAIRKYYNSFDVDEEVEPLIRNRGKYGIPNSIEDLLEDSKWKEEQIRILVEELEKLDFEEDEEDLYYEKC